MTICTYPYLLVPQHIFCYLYDIKKNFELFVNPKISAIKLTLTAKANGFIIVEVHYIATEFILVNKVYGKILV